MIPGQPHPFFLKKSVFNVSVSSVETAQTWSTGGNGGAAAGGGYVCVTGESGATGTWQGTDGVSFSNTALPSASNYTDTIYDPVAGQFVSVAYGVFFVSKAAYATNPNSWTAAASFPLTSGTIRMAQYGSIIIAVQSGGSFTAYAISTDGGVTWSAQTFPDSRSLVDIVATPSGFLTVGNTGDVYTSSTGLTGSWTKTAAALSAGSWSLACNSAGRVVAVKSGTTTYAYSDDNGVTWTTGSMPASGQYLRTKWTGEMYVTYNSNASNQFYYNLTGDGSWSSHTLPSSGWNYNCLVVMSTENVLLAGVNKSCIVTMGSYS